MSVDGRIFPVGTKPADQDSMFAGDWFPVQVKQTDKVGRPMIDQFCTASWSAKTASEASTSPSGWRARRWVVAVRSMQRGRGA